MGNAQNRISSPFNEYGRIEISLEQPYYIAGEVLKGSVIISIHQDYPLRKLEIRFVGEETLKIYRSTKAIKLCDNTVVLDEATRDLTSDVLIPQFLGPGVYKYPFALIMHTKDHLPSTCSYHSSALDCQVTYKLLCYVTSYTNSIPNLKAAREIEILQRLYSQPNKTICQISEISGLFFTAGTATMRVVLDYNGFIVPSGLCLTIEYDNERCLANVKYIKVILEEHISALINEYAKPFKESNTIAEWILEGVQHQKRIALSNKLVIEDPFIEERLESCKSHNFCKYFKLIVVPIYDLCICTSKPYAEFEISITNCTRGKNKLVPRTSIFNKITCESLVIQADETSYSNNLEDYDFKY